SSVMTSRCDPWAAAGDPNGLGSNVSAVPPLLSSANHRGSLAAGRQLSGTAAFGWSTLSTAKHLYGNDAQLVPPANRTSSGTAPAEGPGETSGDAPGLAAAVATGDGNGDGEPHAASATDARPIANPSVRARCCMAGQSPSRIFRRIGMGGAPCEI